MFENNFDVAKGTFEGKEREIICSGEYSPLNEMAKKKTQKAKQF